MEFYKLTPNQQKTLDLIANSQFASLFTFSGGTALSSVHLHHRFSEDLDFFAEEEFDSEQLLQFLTSLKKKLIFSELTFQQSFNRFLFFFHFANGEILKTEFDYYPFPAIEPGMKYKKLRIDSMIDIAANKLHTLSVKSRSRDYIDLYSIFQKEPFSIVDLYFLSKQKFDVHIDPIQLGKQLLAFEPTDMSMLYQPISVEELRSFFEKQAKQLKEQILIP